MRCRYRQVDQCHADVIITVPQMKDLRQIGHVDVGITVAFGQGSERQQWSRVFCSLERQVRITICGIVISVHRSIISPAHDGSGRSNRGLERNRGVREEQRDVVIKTGTIVQHRPVVGKTHLTFIVTDITMYSEVRDHMRFFLVAHEDWEPNSKGQGATEVVMVHKSKSQGKGTVKAQ